MKQQLGAHNAALSTLVTRVNTLVDRKTKKLEARQEKQRLMVSGEVKIGAIYSNE